MALALDDAARAAPWLAACALLLAVFPIAATILPGALEAGLSRAPRPGFHWTWLLPAVLAALVWMLDARGRRLAAVLCVAAGVAAGTLYIKIAALPLVDARTSARLLWREIEGRAGGICVDGIDRNWRYGLNYYSVVPLPECSEQWRPFRLLQSPGARPQLWTWADVTK
jgi:hypothetical protein